MKIAFIVCLSLYLLYFGAGFIASIWLYMLTQDKIDQGAKYWMWNKQSSAVAGECIAAYAFLALLLFLSYFPFFGLRYGHLVIGILLAMIFFACRMIKARWRIEIASRQWESADVASTEAKH